MNLDWKGLLHYTLMGTYTCCEQNWLLYYLFWLLNNWKKQQGKNVPNIKRKRMFSDSLSKLTRGDCFQITKGTKKPFATRSIMGWVFNILFCSPDSVVLISGMSVFGCMALSLIRLKLPSHRMPGSSSGISQSEVRLFCLPALTPRWTAMTNCSNVNHID